MTSCLWGVDGIFSTFALLVDEVVIHEHTDVLVYQHITAEVLAPSPVLINLHVVHSRVASLVRGCG